jgi:hypothetical protein
MATKDSKGASLLFLSSFDLDLSNENMVELISFVDTENLSLAIETQELNILLDDSTKVDSLLTFLKLAGTTFVFSKKNIKGEIYSVDHSWYNLYTDTIEESVAIDNKYLDGISIIKVSDLADEVLGYAATVLSTLSPQKAAKLFSLLNDGVELENTTVSFAANYGGLEIDFNYGIFSVGRTEEIAAQVVGIGSYAVPTQGVLFLLGLEVVKLGKSNLWKAEGILNKVPGLWDKDANYGVVPKDANMYLNKGAKTLKFKSDKTRRVVGFPFYSLVNSKFKVANHNFEDKKTIFCDKTASKTVYSDQASNAAGIFGACVEYTKKNGQKAIQKGQFTIHDTGAAKKTLKGDIDTIVIGAKVLNRITQAMKYQAADLFEVVDGKLVSVRKASKFGTKIMDLDIDCMMEGQLVKVAMTNTTLCRGSGVAVLNPDFFFFYGVDKKLKGRVNYNELTGEALAKYAAVPSKDHGNFYAFLEDVKAVLSAIPKDKVFGPGEIIAEFDFGGKKPHVLFKNKTHNQSFMVTGFNVKLPKISEGDYRPVYSGLELNVKAVKKTRFAKLRGLGIKATTLVDLNDQWFDEKGNKVGYPADVIFNNETRKGQASCLAMYAHSNPNIKTAVVEGDDEGCFLKVTYQDSSVDYIDLMDPMNVVAKWVNSSTKKMKLRSSMPRFEYDQSLDAVKSAGFDLTWKIVEDHDTWVVVEDEVEVLIGYMPVNYEISTADESVGSSSLTPEMMAGMSLLCQKFVEAIYAEAKPTRDALFGLLQMASGSVSDDTVVINLQDPEDLKAMQVTIGNLSGLSDRSVVDVMKLHYAGGCLFKTMGAAENAELFVDWATVGSTMTFIEGSADQISQEIVSAVRFFSCPEKTEVSGIDSTLHSLITSLSGSLYAWVMEGLNSQGMVKKLSRSSNCLINGKARACYDLALIPDSDGIPKIIVHPDCGITKMLAQNSDKSWNEKYLSNYLYEDKASFNANFASDFPHAKLISLKKVEGGAYKAVFFDPYILNGVISPAVRIPMFMPAVCKIVVNEVLEPSYVGILPSVWAKGNSGDSDGDGIGTMNGSSRGMNKEDAIKMNKSVAGMAGYDTIYASSQLPFADFLERPSKKNLIQPKGFAYASFLPHDYVEEFAFDTNYAHIGLYDTHVNTANHYMYSVGTGYGIASAVTSWAAVCALNPDWSDKLPLMEKAILVIWTLIYEGLGLSGYTAKAAEFFNVLRVCSFGTGKDASGNEQYQYAVDSEGEITVAFGDKFKSEKLEAKDAVAYLLKALDLPIDDEDWITVMEILINFNFYRMKYGKLDRGQLNTDNLNEHQLSRISMVGMFRHMGRGYDPATGKDVELIESGDLYGEDSTSCFKLVEDMDYINEFLPEGTWLHKMYTNGLNFMAEASETLLDNAANEVMMQQSGGF